jgi:hypothetical protein
LGYKNNRLNVIKPACISLALLAAAVLSFVVFRTARQGDPDRAKVGRIIPEGSLEREPSLPIQVELAPLDKPVVGGTTRFQVSVESQLDPDLVREVRLEYDLPHRVRRTATLPDNRYALHKSGHSRLALGLVIPDQARYEIRARLVVALTSGSILSETASYWIDLGEEDPPEGMIGRIVEPDGSGIRVYRGVRVGEQE